MIETTRVLNIKNRKIFLRIYLPQNTPRAIVQVNHGLAEHSERYSDFALFLCQKGYAVYIHDHPGHGKSVAEGEIPGHLPWRTGWNLMLSCINQINKSIRKEYPQTPVFILGHSMGSLLTRHYNSSFPMYFNGMILSGTTNPDTSRLNLQWFVIKSLSLIHKPSKKIKWLNRKFYNSFNHSIKKPRTRFDWLSTDNSQVDKYIQDPYCGIDLSLGFFKNLLLGTLRLLRAESTLKFRKNFPVLILSGKDDSVGNNGQDPRSLHKKYLRQGYMNAELMLPAGRHELLNEVNKEQNYQIIDTWMKKYLPLK
jgi:alpha-beta hydrolase superfamily lysophospholipase